MVFSDDIARHTAGHLLQIKAIKLQPDQPFTWSSGWKSPIYCDNRISLSYPHTRGFIKENLVNVIQEHYGSPDLITGVATGAIAMGALVAEEMALPFAYVRPKPKSHGRQNQIEGEVEAGQNAVVIEDLVSTGGSSLGAVEALRKEGVNVLGMTAIFTYGFPLAEENFKKSGCGLVTLSDYEHLINQLHTQGKLDESALNTLKSWRENPAEWG